MKLISLFLAILISTTALAGLPPTTTKGSNDVSDVTTFKFLFPNVTFTHAGTSASFGLVGVASGGTGQTSLTANSVLLGNGTTGVQFVAPGSSGNMLLSNGTTWTSSALSGSAILTSVGAVSPDIQSIYFGGGADCSTACGSGNCTICRQVGNKITSVSFVSTGTYNINGIDGTKYDCLGQGYRGTGSTYESFIGILASSTASFFRVVIAGGTANASYSSIRCIGIP